MGHLQGTDGDIEIPPVKKNMQSIGVLAAGEQNCESVTCECRCFEFPFTESDHRLLITNSTLKPSSPSISMDILPSKKKKKTRPSHQLNSSDESNDEFMQAVSCPTAEKGFCMQRERERVECEVN
jgi:hypothetical protein